MYKKIFIAAFLLIFSFPVFADEANISTISADGTAYSDIEPDTAKIRFYVENTGKNLADIKLKNDKIVSSSISEIKKLLKPQESIKTISLRVTNIYSYKDKIRIFDKYSVTNGFEVKIKDLDKISKIINTAMANGITKVDNLNFYVENTEAVCNGLISEAAKIAKNRAQVVAAATNSTLVKVKSANPYCSLNSNYVTRRVYSNALMAKATGASQEASYDNETIEAGTINANARVDITYYIK
ncbi:SIMPL domain-containing protein [bacterium]|nr:SIMPL domain-containing protein [bacterium]